MKILYGVCGEGLGHASRSRILINYLKDHGCEVKIVSGGKAYRLLSHEFEGVLKVESPTVFYRGNQVRILYTILHTLYQSIGRSPGSFYNVRRLIKEFKPDLLITDAEPISHFAARFSGIKRISIDNPTALIYRKIPKRIREIPAWIFLFFSLKFSLFGADKYLIYDFSDDQINDPRVLFLKPLIQPGIRRQIPTTKDHIFVYQTSLTFSSLFSLLQTFNEPFVVYGFNIERTDRNLIFKRFNEEEFYEDIASAKAVIVNGGFTVISEALFLKKPIFSLPIRHQFEQVFNAQCIQRMGAGIFSHRLCEDDLRQFFSTLESYKKNLEQYDPGNQEETLARILQVIQDVYHTAK